jgi:RNA polymerase sigma factor (sigma-70 family)
VQVFGSVKAITRIRVWFLRIRLRFVVMLAQGADSSDEDSNVSNPAVFAAWVADVAERRDRGAFTRLFDHFAPRLKAYLIRLGTDAALSEEIVQDVMATLWRKAQLFDPAKSSLSTWLYRIARNRRIDLARREKGELDPDEPMLQPAQSPDLDKLMDVQQREEVVRAALTTLPAEQLTLVKLAFFEGLSHSQISETTGLPLGTVKSRIRLAFTRLRRMLEAEGVVEVA